MALCCLCVCFLLQGTESTTRVFGSVSRSLLNRLRLTQFCYRTGILFKPYNVSLEYYYLELVLDCVWASLKEVERYSESICMCEGRTQLAQLQCINRWNSTLWIWCGWEVNDNWTKMHLELFFFSLIFYFPVSNRNEPAIQTGHCWLIMLCWFIFMCNGVTNQFWLCRADVRESIQHFNTFFISCARGRGNQGCKASPLWRLRKCVVLPFILNYSVSSLTDCHTSNHSLCCIFAVCWLTFLNIYSRHSEQERREGRRNSCWEAENTQTRIEEEWLWSK